MVIVLSSLKNLKYMTDILHYRDPNDSREFAEALCKMLTLDNRAMQAISVKARDRIVERFSVDALLDATKQVL